MKEVKITAETVRHYWDNAAASFDDEPDHGLRDPVVLQAWTKLLDSWLFLPGLKLLDIGCGTGSLSIILAGLGHSVVGIDLSPAMISLAEGKAAAAGLPVSFELMDASFPQLPDQQFDGIICRHLLWSLPDLAGVLQRWTSLLKPGGQLMFIEGYWDSGGGLHAETILAALPPSLTSISVQDLSQQPDYWGRPVADERYAIRAALRK